MMSVQIFTCNFIIMEGGDVIQWWPMYVCPPVCRMPRPNSRMERPRKLKIDRMEAQHTGNRWTYLEVKSQRSRSPGRLMLSQTMTIWSSIRRSEHYNFLEISLLTYGPTSSFLSQYPYTVTPGTSKWSPVHLTINFATLAIQHRTLTLAVINYRVID